MDVKSKLAGRDEDSLEDGVGGGEHRGHDGTDRDAVSTVNPEDEPKSANDTNFDLFSQELQTLLLLDRHL